MPYIDVTPEEAVERCKRKGYPYTVIRGKDVIQINPDGTEEVVVTNAYRKIQRKIYYIGKR